MKKTDCCTYNRMIECDGSCRQCHKCGWNPSIREERVRKFCANQVKQTE